MSINVSTLSSDSSKPSRAKSHFSVSVRTSLLTVVTIFIVALMSLAISNLNSAWTSMTAAQTMRSNNDLGDQFLTSATAAAAERGVTAAALNNAQPAASAISTQLVELRAAAGSADV